MFENLKALEEKYEELNKIVADPSTMNDMDKWKAYMKEISDTEPIIQKYREFKQTRDDIDGSKQILEEEKDEELRELAKMELSEKEELMEKVQNELKLTTFDSKRSK